MLTECPSIDREACIVHGFRLCLSRQPELEDVRTLAEFFAKQLRSFEADPVAARELAGDENDWPVGIDAATAAAWTALARVLLNLDEFVCRG